MPEQKKYTRAELFEVSSKVPPGFDGDPNTLDEYVDRLRRWADATEIQPARRGPLAAFRLVGPAEKFQRLLSRERLRTTDGHWRAAIPAGVDAHGNPTPAVPEGAHNDLRGAVMDSSLDYLIAMVTHSFGRVVTETYFGRFRRLMRYKRDAKQSVSSFLLAFYRLLNDFTMDPTAPLVLPELLLSLLMLEAANLSKEEHQRILMRLPPNLANTVVADVELALRHVLMDREDDDKITHSMALEAHCDWPGGDTPEIAGMAQGEVPCDGAGDAWAAWGAEDAAWGHWAGATPEWGVPPVEVSEPLMEEPTWDDVSGCFWVRNKGKGKSGGGKPKGKFGGFPKGKGTPKGYGVYPKGGKDSGGGKGNDGGGSGAAFAGTFQGLCHGCGQWGHRKVDCPKQKEKKPEQGNLCRLGVVMHTGEENTHTHVSTSSGGEFGVRPAPAVVASAALRAKSTGGVAGREDRQRDGREDRQSVGRENRPGREHRRSTSWHAGQGRTGMFALMCARMCAACVPMTPEECTPAVAPGWEPSGSMLKMVDCTNKQKQCAFVAHESDRVECAGLAAGWSILDPGCTRQLVSERPLRRHLDCISKSAGKEAELQREKSDVRYEFAGGGTGRTGNRVNHLLYIGGHSLQSAVEVRGDSEVVAEQTPYLTGIPQLESLEALVSFRKGGVGSTIEYRALGVKRQLHKDEHGHYILNINDHDTNPNDTDERFSSDMQASHGEIKSEEPRQSVGPAVVVKQEERQLDSYERRQLDPGAMGAVLATKCIAALTRWKRRSILLGELPDTDKVMHSTAAMKLEGASDLFADIMCIPSSLDAAMGKM